MIGGFNESLFEGADVVSSFAPVDLFTAINTGAWFSMRDYHRVAIVLIRAGSSTAGDVSTITVKQGNTNAGGGAKALNFTKVRTKSDLTTAAGDTWVPVTAASGNTLTSPAGQGNKVTAAAIDIEGQALDDANSFHWIQATVDKAPSSCLGWCFLLFYGSRHSQFIPVSTLTNL